MELPLRRQQLAGQLLAVPLRTLLHGAKMLAQVIELRETRRRSGA